MLISQKWDLIKFCTWQCNVIELRFMVKEERSYKGKEYKEQFFFLSQL
jgi:hypothetical protein